MNASPVYAASDGTVTINTAWVDEAVHNKRIRFDQAKDILSVMLRHEMRHVLCKHALKEYVWLRAMGYKPERLHTYDEKRKALSAEAR